MKLNKKQKRTATIASMAALLAVVLGMGGQTFAKYIETTETGTQSATVAKWGYVVNSNVTKLFDTTYGTDSDSDNMLEAGTDGNSVVTTGSSNVVAPGTEGSMTLVISGKAEVLSSIKVSVADKVENLGSALATAQDIYYDDYNPLKWTIKNGGVETTVKDGELKDVEAYLEAIGTAHATVAANTEVDYDLEISWKWEFEQGATDAEKKENNGYDTRLGDLVALTETEYNQKYGAGTYTTDKTNSSTTVSFAMKVTVEQIQE